ncbi:hypothetical protein GXW83_00960 [Streptacidiphilus sp. PB12-B1b]|uniref:hypothetical protein n=1 Tax=Streptacidiphilus sp. PB12-B1b TaxID=2705012 RepID=UPI0015FBD7B8|nr:hypothetical protein [Streptacidiphilus sp. PB12-B1b]QMU74565.1 hypothetical protein GXW83_00960 [Streptacidiphilus sp. PB12-B1b]
MTPQDWGFLCGLLATKTPQELAARPFVPTAAKLSQGEQALLTAPAQRHTWKPTSAPQYQRHNLSARGSVPFLLAAHAVNEGINAINKSRAQSKAQGQWIVESSGTLTVTTHGVHYLHPETWATIHWTNSEMCELPAPDVYEVHFRTGQSGNRLGLRLRTIWAPLLFAMTAFASHPGHPRLHDRSWVPPQVAHLYPEVSADLARRAAQRARGEHP